MPDERRRPRRPAEYRMARVVVAGSLTITLILLLVADAISGEYEMSPIALGVLSTMILTLLGIEGLSAIRGDKW